MSHWETSSTLEADVSPVAIWDRAYADAGAWPRWNAEIKRASLDGPLALGAEARIVFRTGLRLRFRVVEFEAGRLFTDESRLPGARMGHPPPGRARRRRRQSPHQHDLHRGPTCLAVAPCARPGRGTNPARRPAGDRRPRRPSFAALAQGIYIDRGP